MSGLDLGLSLFLLVHALMSVSAGFLRGLLGLLGGAGAIALALVATPHVIAAAPAWLPWPQATIGWAVLIFAWAVVPRLAMAMAPVGGRGKLDRALGWLPGLAWGVLGGGVFLWVYAAFAGGIPAGNPVASSLHAYTRPTIEAMSALLPGAGKPDPGPPATALEQEMLALVNAERKKAGLKGLAWDGNLALVGRAHSADMIAKNYFAHEDPAGKTVADRMKRAKLPYLAVGENLAFAPTLPIAHQGLMNSPGHRANILRPQFGRLGIGIVRLKPGQRYVPRHDGKAPAMPPMGLGGYLVLTQVFAN